jgi:hypothetical protein
MYRPAYRKVLDCGSPRPLDEWLPTGQKRRRAGTVPDAVARTQVVVIFLLLASMFSGCATSQPASPQNNFLHAKQLFPPDALVTQRGVLTVHGRQFTLNGYIAKSATGGLRFILTENFGGVLADILVKPDGNVFVLQAKPPFRPAWIKNYVAADLKCIFTGGRETNCPVQMLSPAHFLIERHGYKLDLQTVETKSGAQPAQMFDETREGKP